MIGWFLLIVLVILLIAALPTWPYSGSWSYYPSAIVGAVFIVALLLLLFGWFPYGGTPGNKPGRQPSQTVPE